MSNLETRLAGGLAVAAVALTGVILGGQCRDCNQDERGKIDAGVPHSNPNTLGTSIPRDEARRGVNRVLAIGGSIIDVDEEADAGDIEERRREANKASWLAMACHVDPQPDVSMDDCLRAQGIDPGRAAQKLAEQAKKDVDGHAHWHLGMLESARHPGLEDEGVEAIIEEEHGITPEFADVATSVSTINVARESLLKDDVTPDMARIELQKIADEYLNLLGHIEAGGDLTEVIESIQTGLKMSKQGLADDIESIADMLGGAQRKKLEQFAELVRQNI